MSVRAVSRRRWFIALTALALIAGIAGPAAPQDAPAGSPERGKVVFEKCVACHTTDDVKPADGTAPAGPSLRGIIGKKAASRDDFRYSPAMTRSGVVWSTETLSAYIADPQAFMRGNRMSFAGIVEKGERDDLIAFLLQATRVGQ